MYVHKGCPPAISLQICSNCNRTSEIPDILQTFWVLSIVSIPTSSKIRSIFQKSLSSSSSYCSKSTLLFSCIFRFNLCMKAFMEIRGPLPSTFAPKRTLVMRLLTSALIAQEHAMC
uniref:Uncharacterized protein n=1 Tax=Arundo donax TaxID=35708 RepID=A0A0A8Z4I0_ARUDO